jgi:hypothetical protein
MEGLSRQDPHPSWTIRGDDAWIEIETHKEEAHQSLGQPGNGGVEVVPGGNLLCKAHSSLSSLRQVNNKLSDDRVVSTTSTMRPARLATTTGQSLPRHQNTSTGKHTSSTQAFTGAIDVPPAIAAAGGGRPTQSVLQSAAFYGWIESGMRNGAVGTRRVIVANIVAKNGRDSLDVWIDLETNERRLRRRAG